MLPITFDRVISDGEAHLYRDQSGDPVRITKAEYFATDQEREAAIQMYETFYKPNSWN